MPHTQKTQSSSDAKENLRSRIARRISLFDSSEFRKAIQRKSELADPIDLSIGVPEETTPEYIKQAGIRAIQEDKTQYTPAAGILELREALARKLRNDCGIS